MSYLIRVNPGHPSSVSTPIHFFRHALGVPARRLWAGFAGVWLFMAVLSATQLHLLFSLRGAPLPYWRILIQTGVEWLLYGAFIPVILWLGDRLPIKGRRWAWKALAHAGFAMTLALPFALATSLLWTVIGTAAFLEPGGRMATALTWYVNSLTILLFAYFGIHFLGRAVYWFARHRETELQTARLESEMATARLSALQAQVHPHFLFNSLNAVDTLIHDGDKEGASGVIHSMSDLLRAALAHGGTRTVPLAEEIDLVRQYLAIQEVRFPGRLQVAIEAPDPTLPVPVPPFVLQPLVENALRHGIAQRGDAGRISIRAALEHRRLTLTVDDDGPGPPSAAPTGGVGLGNIRARLQLMYGGSASLDLLRNAWGGASAVLSLPAHSPAPDA